MIKQIQPIVNDTVAMKQAKKKARAALKRVYQRELRECQTPAEKYLWEEIKDKRLGFKFTPQAIIHGFLPDFWCEALSLVIEVDGAIHLKRKNYDRWREAILKSHKISVLRFTNDQVFKSRDQCVDEIKATIQRLRASSHRRRSTIKKPKWMDKE